MNNPAEMVRVPCMSCFENDDQYEQNEDKQCDCHSGTCQQHAKCLVSVQIWEEKRIISRTIPFYTLGNPVQSPACTAQSTLCSLEVGIEFLE
jgi:hypothetical protein